MICIRAEIPKEVCEINDELKAIYHSNNSICIWVFKTRIERNGFVAVSYTHLTLPTNREV